MKIGPQENHQSRVCTAVPCCGMAPEAQGPSAAFPDQKAHASRSCRSAQVSAPHSHQALRQCKRGLVQEHSPDEAQPHSISSQNRVSGTGRCAETQKLGSPHSCIPGTGSTLPVLLRKVCSTANQPPALYFLWLVVSASNPIDAFAFLLIFLPSKRLLLPTLRSHRPSPSSAPVPGTSTSHSQKAEPPVEKSILHNLRLSLNTGYQHRKKHYKNLHPFPCKLASPGPLHNSFT